MSTPGRFRGMMYGPSNMVLTGGGGTGTFDMAAANKGYCFRFMALSTKDIKSVRVHWSTFTVGTGTMTMRIETIDATSGKPTGTLYDSNAVITSITPVTGAITTYTFATLPTTGLTVGAEYGVVFLTTAAFTACLIRTYPLLIGIALDSNYPASCLSATDGTTRTNFAEVSGSIAPTVSFILEDDTEDPFNCYPFISNASSFAISGTRAWAGKFIISHRIVIAGIKVVCTKNGTPAGDIRCRIMDSANAVIDGTTITLDKDSVITTGMTGRFFPFPAMVTLTPGTYRIVIDSSGCSAGNDWDMRNATPLNAAVTAASPFTVSTTTDVTATPITWTDDATGLVPCVTLVLDDILVVGSGIAG